MSSVTDSSASVYVVLDSLRRLSFHSNLLSRRSYYILVFVLLVLLGVISPYLIRVVSFSKSMSMTWFVSMRSFGQLKR